MPLWTRTKNHRHQISPKMDIQTLRRISLNFLMLDLVTLRELKSSEFADKYDQICDKDPLAAKIPLNTVGYEVFDTDMLKQELKKLAYDELVKRISDPGASSFYAAMLSTLVSRVRQARKEHSHILFHPGLHSDVERDDEEYLLQLEELQLENDDDPGFYPFGYDDLLLTVRKAQHLKEYYGDAVRENSLPRLALFLFQAKLEVLDRDYDDACNALGLDYTPLVHTQSNIASSDEKPISIPPDSPTPIVRNKGPSHWRTSQIFNFLIPAICLISWIPTALSWIHAGSEVGTATDANFYQTISSVIMQLLGIVTSLWPAITDLRLDRVANMLVFVSAAGGAVLTITAIPLYLSCPVKWSGAALYCGSIGQFLLQLQLMLGILHKNLKAHQD